MLIALRALQGFAAALMSPAALSIVLINYKEGHERNVALAVWGAVASGGAAAGVLLGGILTEYLNWRWNFFINVPVAIGVILTAYRIVPKHESEERHNDLDLPGAISITAAMMLLVYTLVEAPLKGWTDSTTLIRFGISAALLAFFIWNESRVKRPLMPLRIFKIRNLTGANLTIFPVVASMFSMFYFLSLYLQTVLHYSPVKTGLSFLVVPLTIAITASNVPKLIQKIGYKPILTVAPLLIGTALFIFAHVPVDGHYVSNILPGLIILGFGMGMSFVAGTIAATSGVPGHESGLASGILNTSQQIGGALGLAVLTGVAASATKDAFQTLPAHVSSKEAVFAYTSVQGFHAAFYVGVVFTIIASLVAATVIKQQRVPKKAAEEATVAVGH
jgi:EmrB/QacA subfamily drug resistance transporter